MRERGEGAAREVLVHFLGFNARLDIWLLASSEERLKARNGAWDWGSISGSLGDEQWVVDFVVKRKIEHGIAQALVRWEDWSEEYDQWVDELDIDPELLEGIEVEVEPKKKTFKRPPAEPYTVKGSREKNYNAETLDDLVETWVDTVGMKGAKALARQKEEWASKLFFSTDPIPPVMFVALRDRLADSNWCARWPAHAPRRAHPCTRRACHARERARDTLPRPSSRPHPLYINAPLGVLKTRNLCVRPARQVRHAAVPAPRRRSGGRARPAGSWRDACAFSLLRVLF